MHLLEFKYLIFDYDEKYLKRIYSKPKQQSKTKI